MDAQQRDDNPIEQSRLAKVRQAVGNLRSPIGKAWNWSQASRLRMIVVGTSTALTATIVVGLAIYLTLLRSRQETAWTPEQAIEALEQNELVRAKTIALALLEAGSLEPAEAGLPDYVLGMIAYYDAQEAWDEKLLADLYREAITHLEQADDLGIPAEHQRQGAYSLGDSHYQVNQFEPCAAVLRGALPLFSPSDTLVANIHHMLAESYFYHADPQLEDALQWNEQSLEHPHLTPTQTDEAYLLQAEILLRMDETARAESAIRQLSETGQADARALLLRGRILAALADVTLQDSSIEAAERQALSARHLQNALVELQKSTAHNTLDHTVGSQAMYLMGTIHQRLGNLETALEQFVKTQSADRESPEAIAAGLAEADLHRILDQHAEALNQYARTLDAIERQAPFSNRWLSLEELKTRMRDAQQAFRENYHFAEALELTRHFNTIMSHAELLQMRAHTERDWADHLTDRAEQAIPSAAASPSDATTQLWESRRHYRQAGVHFARLARQEFTSREYPEHLWNAAENLRTGHDYQQAAVVYQQYLENSARGRQSGALLGLGESFMGLAKFDEAVKILRKCVSLYPRDPISYQARIVGSRAHRELGQYELARQLLHENLFHGALTPRSREWQDSLFEFGTTLHTEGVATLTQARQLGIESDDPQLQEAALPELERSYVLFQDAITRLEEAVQRYPDADQVFQARYQIADSQRLAARLPSYHQRVVAIETSRQRYETENNSLLESALENYTALQQSLILAQDEGNLSPTEAALLRNCYFSRGTVLLERGRFEDAIRAFASTSSRYQRDPVALEAQLQIANCHRQLGQPLDARSSIEHAVLILEGIPTDADFAGTTRYDRQEWTDLLSWLSQS